MQDLKKWFDKANIPLKIEKEPLNSIGLSVNNKDIFQLTIDKKGKKQEEYFRLYYGHQDNDVRVINADSKHQQIILLVNEPEREYTVRTWDRKKNDWVYEKQKSPNFLRKYLMGMDESHLFIAELPNYSKPIINTVKDAHKALKPNKVLEKEKITYRIKRQGEWFFIPAIKEEIEQIEENSNLLEKKRRIGINSGNSGNSHIADQLITIGEEQFVTGKVFHIEHKTLKLHGWFKVVRNNEARQSNISSNQIYNGVKWVD